MTRPFFEDACYFINLAENARESGSARRHSVQAVLFFALGMERVLKTVLHDLNPSFVLVDPTFNNALPVLHGDRVLPDQKQAKELKSSPNHDVITLRESIFRCKLISPATRAHQAVLFRLSQMRDIICHHRLDLLMDADITSIIWRDFASVTEHFASELGTTREVLVGITDRQESEKREIEEAPRRLADLLEKHNASYLDVSSRNADYDKTARQKTVAIQKRGRPGDWFFVESECPACKNAALVRGQVDYDWDPTEGTGVPIGVYADGLF